MEGFVSVIGRTPLIRLRTLSEQTGCTILGKAEFMNPGGSVKDRAAWGMVRDAERKGLLKAGATIVEGTAGNTGIGLAHVCKSRGYRCVIFMPDTQSREKMDALRFLGATVFAVPAVPFSDPQNYNHQARRYAEEHENHHWTDQFDNQANRAYHEETTGPEIWEQAHALARNNATEAQPFSESDFASKLAFITAVGTGGTLGGVTNALKARSKSVKCFAADPPGSCIFAYYTKGVLERTGTSSITEGIGQGRVTGNLKDVLVDGAIHVEDARTISMIFHMREKEGLALGASTCLNLVGAVELAKQLGPGHTIVTVLCDTASKYHSRLFNRAWLESKNLLQYVPEECLESLS